MLNRLKKSNEGFTIIEVLIVLAIAGLILLVVFLAVPALQRNQRNTGRKNDAARIAAAVNDFISNSNGNLPTKANDGAVIIKSAGNLANLGDSTGALADGTGAAAANCAAAVTMTGSNTLQVCKYSVASTITAAATDGVLVVTGGQCNGANQTSAGSSRQVAVFYTQEAGNSFNVACQNL